ncbi:MAG TPA: tetratricopeptide repeat protein, partial [Candidatus Paceibacterota bacterium]|nr:tetratricopeptide repeat protein [Candidatus Paceibacterota bacterium]
IFGLLFFLTAFFFQSKKRILNLYFAVLASGIVVAAVQMIKLAVPGLFAVVSLGNPPLNLVGKWNSLGIFLGLCVIVSLILSNLIAKSAQSVQLLLKISLAVSLIGVAFVNFYPVWAVLAVSSAAVLLYGRLANKSSEEAVKPSGWKNAGVLVFAVALLFTVLGREGSVLYRNIAALQQRVGVSVIEVRPSFGGTVDIAEQTLKRSPLFGAGPNHFALEWIKYKPASVNQTQFWNANFDAGVGTLTTVPVTTGLLGVLAWLAFLGAVAYWGIKGLRQTADNRTNQGVVFLSLATVVYLWIFMAIYVLDTALMAWAFIALGLLTATLWELKLVPTATISLGRTGAAGITVAGVMAALVLMSLYAAGTKNGATLSYYRGMSLMDAGASIDKVEKHVATAARLAGNDLYYRSLVDIGLAKMNQQASAPRPADQTDEQAAGAFQAILSQTLANAERAFQANEHNYLNASYQGRVSEFVVPLKVSGAYKSAHDWYTRAVALNPQNPAGYLDLARLEVANGDNAKARQHVAKALEIKSDYAAAILFLAQLEAEEGNLAEAAAKAEEGTKLAPTDVGAWFQLGFFRYRADDYSKAREALEQALKLSPSYANAQYFLGLTYDRLGLKPEALAQFEAIARSNPGNKEVGAIIENLRAGQPALSGISAEGEGDEEPPIQEE